MYFLVIHNADLIFVDILHVRPLRPLLWSQLALTAKTTHFEGQTSPRAGKPLILPIFMCYNSPYFFVIWNYKIIFAKILRGRPLRP